jgi:hypothetical protein
MSSCVFICCESGISLLKDVNLARCRVFVGALKIDILNQHSDPQIHIQSVLPAPTLTKTYCYPVIEKSSYLGRYSDPLLPRSPIQLGLISISRIHGTPGLIKA